MKTIIDNGEALLWSRSDHLLETRFVPLTNDGGEKDAFTPNPCRTKMETRMDKITPCLGLLSYAHLCVPRVLSLLM